MYPNKNTDQSPAYPTPKDRVNDETDNYGTYETGNREDIPYSEERKVFSRPTAHLSQDSEPVIVASGYAGGNTRAIPRQNAELDDRKVKFCRVSSGIKKGIKRTTLFPDDK
jgi:hypothetical protein